MPAVDDWGGYAGYQRNISTSTTNYDTVCSAAGTYSLGIQDAGDAGSYGFDKVGSWVDLINAWELVATTGGTVTSNYIPFLHPVPSGAGYYSLCYVVDGDGVITNRRLYGAPGHRCHIQTILVDMQYYVSETNTFPAFSDIWNVNY